MTVALVLVSHVAEIAEGVRRLAAQMAPDVAILPAGGDDEGGVGTSFDRVATALQQAQGPGGTVVLYDLGSALLTAETAVEMLGQDQVQIVDAPLVEGTLAAATVAQQGGDLAAVARAAREQGGGSATAGDGAPESVSEPAADAVTGEVTLRNPLGLHARPAADLARLVTETDARVLLRGHDGTWVDARSVVAVIGLGLRGGDTVRLAAEGETAAEVLRRAQELVESGFGEAGGPGSPTTLSGVAAAPGGAEGPAVLVTQTPRADEPSRPESVETERLRTAVDSAASELASVKEVFLPIARAQHALLEDPMLGGRAADLVRRGEAAGKAWDTAVDEAHALLAAVPDAAMADRAADVLDVGARVASALAGGDYDAGLPDLRALSGAVVIADDILPSQVVRAHAAGASAVVGARGGASAHAAQLARALGIPAVLGTGEGLHAITAGRLLRVDGDRGTVEIR